MNDGPYRQWLDPYREEITRNFEEAATEVSRFPEPLKGLGLALLHRMNPQQSSGGTNYIGFLLPYWLQEQTDSSLELCRDLAVGNIYAMLHFFLLDDVMDAGSNLHTKEEVRKALLLGQLCEALFQERYRRYFPGESPLWNRYRNYLSEWAEAVAQEADSPADPRNPARLAGKSAPIKLCTAGLLLKSGQEDEIANLEAAITLTLATLQLSDDWTDWREDLVAEERGNAFLMLVRERLGLSADRPLDERQVKQALYRSSCLNDLVDIVEGYGARLASCLRVPQRLVDFHADMTEDLRSDAQKAEKVTEALANGGGFSYIMTQIRN